MYYIKIGDQEFEFSTTLRTAQAICARYKLALQELAQKLGTALPAELVDVLKMGLAQKERGKELEDTVLDGGLGGFALMNHASKYLLELTYPGDAEEKEQQIEAAAMGDEQKNALRAALGLPTKHSEPSDSGSN